MKRKRPDVARTRTLENDMDLAHACAHIARKLGLTPDEIDLNDPSLTYVAAAIISYHLIPIDKDPLAKYRAYNDLVAYLESAPTNTKSARLLFSRTMNYVRSINPYHEPEQRNLPMQMRLFI